MTFMIETKYFLTGQQDVVDKQRKGGRIFNQNMLIFPIPHDEHRLTCPRFCLKTELVLLDFIQGNKAERFKYGIMDRRKFMSAVSAGLVARENMLPFSSFTKTKGIRWSMGWILWRNYKGRKIPLQEAIQDLRDLGLQGIEFTPRRDELSTFGLRREGFRDLLKENGLAVSGHYFGAPFHDPGRSKEIMTSFQESIDSLKFYGAKNIIIGPPGNRAGDDHPELIRRAAPVLNTLGKIALDQGFEIGIHPHFNCIIETPEEIRLAMDLTDPKYVFLSADTGHIALGGGNVAKVLRTYKDRLNYFHFKDVAGTVTRPNFAPNLREIGSGEIDFPGIMALLKEIHYKGWINVEQDATTLTPRESASRSMGYINKKLKRF
jgi:sugar phosphate isomerase/epimerase